MNDRDARRKILLLKGTLHRLEILQARHVWQSTSARDAVIGSLPALLKAVLTYRRTALLATLLSLVSGQGRFRRIVRRALLVSGGIAGAWALLKRGKAAADQASGADR